MQRYNGAAVMRPIPVSVTDTSKDIRVSFLLGDPHLGMLSWHLETGEDFDLKIAEAHMNTAIDLLVQRSPDAESCVVANLGDFFHANDDTAATPRGGNRLDVDSRFAHVTDIGYGMMRRIIDRARIKYPKVLVLTCPAIMIRHRLADSLSGLRRYMRTVLKWKLSPTLTLMYSWSLVTTSICTTTGMGQR
jgi:hypothetical protein